VLWIVPALALAGVLIPVAIRPRLTLSRQARSWPRQLLRSAC
jgi:hypothetical protein